MTGAGGGVAYGLWERIDQELYAQGKSQRWLVAASGIPTTTINRLKVTKRRPAPHIVKALAATLGIAEEEAKALAGYGPTERLTDEPAAPPVDPLEAIRHSPLYTEEQKRTLLAMAAAFEQLNATDQDGPAETRRTG